MDAVAVQADRVSINFQRALFAVTLAPIAIVLAGHYWGVPALLHSRAMLITLTAGPHVTATGAVYLDPEMRPQIKADPSRYVWVPAMLTVGSALLLAADASAVKVLFTFYVAWLLWHYTKQNLGAFSFLCRARRAPGPSQIERKLILATAGAGTLGTLAVSPKYFAPHWMLSDLRAAGLVVYVGCLAAFAIRVAKAGRQDRGRLAYLTIIMLFYLPLFLYSDSLAAFNAFAAAHGAQYLLFSSYLRNGRPAEERRSYNLALLACIVVGGFVLAHIHASLWAGGWRWLAGAVTGATLAHFYIDGGMWKLSQSAQRAYMKQRFAFLN